MTGRFGQAHISRYDCAVYLLLYIRPDIFHHLQGQICSGVKHGKYDTFDIQIRIQTLSYQIDRMDQLT